MPNITKHEFRTKNKNRIAYFKIDNVIFIGDTKDNFMYLNEKHIQECIDFEPPKQERKEIV